MTPTRWARYSALAWISELSPSCGIVMSLIASGEKARANAACISGTRKTRVPAPVRATKTPTRRPTSSCLQIRSAVAISLLAEQRPRAEPGLLNDDIASKQPRAELADRGVQTVPLEEMFFRTQAQKHKPGHPHLRAEDKVAEILIF